MEAKTNTELQKAIVLHTRPYQNSSLLIDFFTEHSGIIRCVAKGARSKRKSEPLTQFCIYKINYSGKSDLKTLKVYEPFKRYHLTKTPLFCGFYINELCLRLLYTHDPHPNVFVLLSKSLDQLSELSTQTQARGDIELILRAFEFSLLQEIGYLVDFNVDCMTGAKISPDKRYQFLHSRGFTENQLFQTESSEKVISFSGATLAAIQEHTNLKENLAILPEESEHTLTDSQTETDQLFKKESKTLSRLMLASLLGDKPLQSRSLFANLTL